MSQPELLKPHLIYYAGFNVKLELHSKGAIIHIYDEKRNAWIPAALSVIDLECLSEILTEALRNRKKSDKG